MFKIKITTDEGEVWPTITSEHEPALHVSGRILEVRLADGHLRWIHLTDRIEHVDVTREP